MMRIISILHLPSLPGHARDSETPPRAVICPAEEDGLELLQAAGRRIGRASNCVA